MNIIQIVIFFNVFDVQVFVVFVMMYFGFEEVMFVEGFVFLQYLGFVLNVIFFEIGFVMFCFQEIVGFVGQGMFFVFVVDDIDGEFVCIFGVGVWVVMLLEIELWGECYCQFVDFNGFVWQFVQWVF